MRHKIIVNRLQQILDERGISQRKLAAEIGVRSATINGLCNNSNVVTMNKDIVAKVMDYLDIADFNEILRIIEVELPPDFADLNKLDTEQVERLREIIAERLGERSTKE